VLYINRPAANIIDWRKFFLLFLCRPAVSVFAAATRIDDLAKGQKMSERKPKLSPEKT